MLTGNEREPSEAGICSPSLGRGVGFVPGHVASAERSASLGVVSSETRVVALEMGLSNPLTKTALSNGVSELALTSGIVSAVSIAAPKALLLKGFITSAPLSTREKPENSDSTATPGVDIQAGNASRGGSGWWG